MFDFIRTHQRLMQLVLLVLILPSFVLIGVSGYTNYVSGDKDLVTVGDSAVTLQEFELARRNQLEQLQRSSMGRVDPEVLNTRPAREMLLESLVDRRVLVETATRERFSVSDAQLREAIASMPEFQEDGRFSAEQYNQLLASAGLSTRDFEQGQRGEMALQRVLGPVANSAFMPDYVLQQVSAALTEQRSLSLRVFPASEYEKDIEVSEADIQAWYDENKERLRVADQVAVQYLLLNEDVAMQAVAEVPEADLRAYYEQNKSRYVTAPRVNVSHIQISVPAGASDADKLAAQARAEELAAQVKADPATFAEVARTSSNDVGTARDGGRLGWVTPNSWPAALEAAVFALEEGEISDVVEGPAGYHIFLANQVEPEKGETFEEAREKVEAEVRRQLASERFAELATRLTDLVYDNPASLEPAAQELGIDLRSVTGVTRDGLLGVEEAGSQAAAASPDAALFEDPRVRNILFSPASLKDKANSGVIEISADTLLVVRVQDFEPSHVPPLEQVVGQVESFLVSERARAAAKAEGERVLAQLSSGGPNVDGGAVAGAAAGHSAGAGAEASADAAAEDDGDIAAAETATGFGQTLTVSRLDNQGVAKAVLDAVFAADASALPAYVGVEGPQGYVLARIESVEAGQTDTSLVAGLGLELARSWGAAEERAVLDQMRRDLGVTRTPDVEEVLSGETTE